MIAYRAWRQTWGCGAFVNDIDQIEWRLVDGDVVPIMALEMTRLDGGVHPPATYFEAILTRYQRRDGQALAITAFAERLGVPAVIVLWRHDLSDFWIYNLSTHQGWFYLTAPQYKRWLISHPTTMELEP